MSRRPGILCGKSCIKKCEMTNVPDKFPQLISLESEDYMFENEKKKQKKKTGV